MAIDIKYKAEYPANILSNFWPRPFLIDGVECASMEGFLQSLKTKDPDKQRTVCLLCAKEAKNYFKHRWDNLRWKLTGNLYWRGQKIKRSSRDYQRLLDRAFELMSEDPEFRRALLATKNEKLTHSIGKSNPRLTVLTESEFIGRLERIRNEISQI